MRTGIFVVCLVVPFVHTLAGAVMAGAAAPLTADSLRLAGRALELAGPLKLEQALALAAAHHPRLSSATWRLHAAAQRRRDAGRPPNPAVAAELEDLGAGLGTDVWQATVSLSQPIELGGDARARARVAAAGEAIAQAELATEERAILALTAERFLECWTLQERVRQLNEAEEIAQRSIAAATERFRAGAGPAMERARAEAAYALRRAERIRASADLAAGRQRLAGSWGSEEAGFDSLRLEPGVARPIPSASQLYARLEAHPERRRSAAEVELEAARLREARAAGIGDVTVSAGVRRLAAQDLTGLVFGLSMPLPLWNRQSGTIAALDAERQSAASRSRAAMFELRDLLRSAHERYVAAHQSYELVRAEVKPRSDEALAQLTSGYRAGRFSSLEYLDGQRSVLEAELLLIDATAEAWRARLALERLAGATIEQLEQEVGP